MLIKWYGINAFEFLTDSGTRFMMDICVSRDRVKLHIPQEVDKYVTTTPKFVLMTHAHWDHLADMPYIIQKTDTVLYASQTACNIMRALDVPEKNLREIHAGDVLKLDDVKVTVIESRHMGHDTPGPFYQNIPQKEQLTVADNWHCGDIFGFKIEADGMTILNIGSANFYEPAFNGMTCDYFLCGISLWKPGFPEKLLRNVSFKTLIPTHHDIFKGRPLSDFALKDDFIRLKAAIPDLNARELPVLKWERL